MPRPDGFVLVWQSKPLKASNLNIPTGGANTNPTGFIGLGKGVFDAIDQLTYFRDLAFDGLNWVVDDPAKPHLELAASVDFRILIKQTDYGIHKLDIRHNADSSMATAKQHNHMTALRWGGARALVAQPDLLGRTLSIYRSDASPPTFLLDID